MANEKNLKPLTELSKEEAKKIREKGGKARVKQRREKKALKERLELMLEIVKDKQKKELPEELAKDLDDVGADVYAIMKLMFSKKVKSETKLRAIERVWDRVHGKPEETIKNINFDGETFHIDGEDFSDI